MTELSFKPSDHVLAAAGMTVTACYSGAPDDLRLADEMLAQARTQKGDCDRLIAVIAVSDEVTPAQHPTKF